jgi:hypothetical protein
MVKLAHRLLIAVLVLGVLAPAASGAPAGRFTAHADLVPTGCAQEISGAVVRITGCTADGSAAGTIPGRLRLEYSAKVELTRGSGTQQGTLTLASASGKDVLVARFHGTLNAGTGTSSGTWTATKRQGRFVKIATRGSYTSRSADRGVHVSFDVRG